jgi:hypothetical protein
MVLITGKHKVVTSNSTTMKALTRSPRICTFILAMKGIKPVGSKLDFYGAKD